jgi:hypothetical protein
VNRYVEVQKTKRKDWVDLKGQSFGSWYVLEANIPGQSVWRCKCVCGNTALIWSYELQNGYRNTCRKCRGKKISEKLKGKIYPEKRTKKDDRRSARGIEWRNTVLAKDNYICQNCFKVFDPAKKYKRGFSPETHHIKPWEIYPEFRFDPNNGITYCTDCHKGREKKIRKQNSLIVKALEETVNKDFGQVIDIMSELNKLIKTRIE